MSRLIDRMAANLETHYCPADRRYRVVLDPRAAFPDDPDNGTVAMVYGPNNASATFARAVDTELPTAVACWLDSITEYVDDFTMAAVDAARERGNKA